MKKQKNYLINGFEQYIGDHFPAQSDKLIKQMHHRLTELLSANAGASPQKMHHLNAQILPGIAIYETLQTILSKDEAYAVVHTIVASHAKTIRVKIERLLKIPGLYRLVPSIFSKMTQSLFGPSAGFAATKYPIKHGWRIDMTQCPYFDTCRQNRCPELCTCFCDSDDISYDHLHKNLIWHRSKTLGRGNECCDFCLKVQRRS